MLIYTVDFNLLFYYRMKNTANEKPFRLWPVTAYSGKREESEPTQMFRTLDLPTDSNADQIGRHDSTTK